MSELNSNNEFKELDDFFSESLRDASIKPSADVWSGIEKNLEEKRKKKYFLWFLPSLILLIGGAIGAYFFIPEGFFNNTTSEKKQTAVTNTIPTHIKSTTDNNLTKNEERTSDEKTTEITQPKTITKKIQIAALKNSNADLPTEIVGLTVKSEKGNDNIKRFFVEVSGTEISSAINNLKNAGYKDAFVVGPKQNQLATLSKTRFEHLISKNSSPVSSVPNSLIASNTSKSKNINQETNSTIASNNNTVSEYKSQNTNQEIISNNSSVESKSAKDNNTENATGSTTQDPITVGGNSELTIKKNNAIEEPAITTNSVSPTNSVATNTPTETIENIAKPDSVKPETKTEIVSSPPKTKSDSVKPPLKIDPRFAVYLLGGPAFTQTLPSPKFAHETSPVKYNAEIKFQFFPVKKVAVELGANYQTCSSVSQENFYIFNKFDPSDSKIHSSLGDMSVSHTDLMIGFSMMGPIDSLRVKYKYKINYSVINIPLILKFYPVKKDKLAISVFIAENNQLVLNRSAQLTIIKEFSEENYSYSNIPGKNFNMSLMLGMGCEFKLYKNLDFVVEPNARYYITNPNSNSAIKSQRINFNGNAGFKLAF